MSRFVFALFCLLACRPAMASGLRLRAALLYRRSGSIQLRGQSYSSALNPQRFLPKAYLLDGADDLGYGDRYFEDGYVCMDPGSGNVNSPLPDSTWNWGYQNAAQYDAEAHTLSFLAKKTVEQRLVEELSLHSAQQRHSFSASEALGLELAGEYGSLQCCGGELALSLGWLWIPEWQRRLDVRSFSGSFWLREGLRDLQQRYTYASYGAELPPPGHAGSYAGPFDQPPQESTVLIHNKPEYIENVSLGGFQAQSEEQVFLHNKVRYKIDWQEQEFFVGPQFRKPLCQSLDCCLSARLSLRYLHCAVKRQEQLYQKNQQGTQVLQQWRDSSSSSRLMPGAGLAVALEKQLGKGFFAGIQLAWNYYPRQISFRSGPDRLRIRRSALDGAAQIGYRF
ncbi:MAG: hypothetical protein PHG44_00615 [Lentisphaeria bacterium]|jgi:hypothetical protein|nr:hypothetical protein [Lentisphaeria bacterium]